MNTAIYSPSGASAGIGFSIPADEVRSVVPDLIQYGKIRRPSLGIVPYASTSYKINGVLIIQVADNSAAEKAGLHGTDRDRFGQIRWGISSYRLMIMRLPAWSKCGRYWNNTKRAIR